MDGWQNLLRCSKKCLENVFDLWPKTNFVCKQILPVLKHIQKIKLIYNWNKSETDSKKSFFSNYKKSVWNGQWPLGAFFVLCHCFLNVWNVLAYPSVVKGENCCFRVNFTPSVVEWLLSPRERIYVMVHRTHTFLNLW